jgi:hypothetical protein
MEPIMPENEGGSYREKAEGTLRGLTGMSSRDNEMAATVAIGYALLAILDEIHAIGERIAPPQTLGPTTGIEVQI